MGKKIKEEMDRLKGEFSKGAVKRGFNRDIAEELFDLIVKFAGYGFNKSHSAAYAMITFYTSFLKTYHPTEFMSAILTLEKHNTDKVVSMLMRLKGGFELFGGYGTSRIVNFLQDFTFSGPGRWLTGRIDWLVFFGKWGANLGEALEELVWGQLKASLFTFTRKEGGIRLGWGKRF